MGRGLVDGSRGWYILAAFTLFQNKTRAPEMTPDVAKRSTVSLMGHEFEEPHAGELLDVDADVLQILLEDGPPSEEESEADAISVSSNWSSDQFNIPLRDTDILCSSGIYSKADHPGNVRMRRIIDRYVVKWCRASKKEQQRRLIADMLLASQNPRFLIAGIKHCNILYCREASTDEVELEIKGELLRHFDVIPTEQDYIFGRGKGAYDWPGNVNCREYMTRRIARYQNQGRSGKAAIVQDVMNFVDNQGGRFLYPFITDPAGGCIKVGGCIVAKDKKDIKEKLKSFLRQSKGGLRNRWVGGSVLVTLCLGIFWYTGFQDDPSSAHTDIDTTRMLKVSAEERFQKLLSKDVDLLARVPTYTMERDVKERTTEKGFTYSSTMFHDSVRFAGSEE